MKLLHSNDRVLLISPHPDDFEFGCGGTIYRYKNEIKTKLLVLSTRLRTRGEEKNKEQQKKSAEIFGCRDIKFFDFHIRFFNSAENRDKLRTVITDESNRFKPDVIFIPSLNETMQDHQALAEEVVRIIKGPTILGYEVPKHSNVFNPDVFIKIS